MENVFTKKIKLKAVIDEKQPLKLNSRADGAVYTVQIKQGRFVFITSQTSGKTFKHEGKKLVYVKP